VPEGYTIVVKTHFEIQVRKNGVTKTAKATFTVKKKE